MDEEWDADFEPKALPTAPAVGANKWEGEDEDDEVKDNWEDEEEEEEKKDVEKQELSKTAPAKKPKKIREKIEEREQRLREEQEKKIQSDITPEELQAEKLHREKMQQESDLRVAMETFGTAESSTATGIDAMNPESKEEFDELQEALTKKINLHSKSTHFPTFAEDLIRNICVNLTSHDLKKLKMTVENIFIEKSKVEKGDKAKKKGKGKAKLRVEGENTLVNEYSAYGDYDDFDDFM